MLFVRFSYYKNRKLHCTMRCGAERCTITYGVVRLFHFAGDFGTIIAVCAVW